MRVSPWQLAEALGLPPPTAEQAAVIAAPPGPTLVVAGAGAGKTETMAARVVWMVANGLVTPDAVLGLTFTRKAAQQLTARIRTRLARLAGAPLLRNLDPDGGLRARLTGSEPEISTYHSYAGRLLGEHGLLLPVEPTATLLTQTQLWQLAHRVVTTWDGELETDRTPVSVTEAVLALSGQLAEHLVAPADLRHAHADLERLVFTLPKGPRQRGGPSRDLQNIVAAQQERVALLPLVQRLHDELSRRGALDFGAQMSLAARLAVEHPEVGAAERARFDLVLLDEYQDTGHAQRILLAGLFGDPRGALGTKEATSAEPAHARYRPEPAGAEAVSRLVDAAAARLDSERAEKGPRGSRADGGTGLEPAAAEADSNADSASQLDVLLRAQNRSDVEPGPVAQVAGSDLESAAEHSRPARTAGEESTRVRGTGDARHGLEPSEPQVDSRPGAQRQLAVTAVGDPMQSIYGWRGASAANLPRFTTDFPAANGEPAPVLALLTSWRNPPEALDLANLVAEPLRRNDSGVTVDALRPRPDATAGTVALALLETVADERDWLAERIAAEWEAAADADRSPPTSAVLVRRNADAAPLAEALRERGLPVEIVGLGGLLATPEVADVVATLRLIADPGAGSAAMRLLTGARWRLGVTDLAELARRARELSISDPEQTPAITDQAGLARALLAVAPEPAERAGIADAIADPGAPVRYSPAGFERISELGRELAALRERAGQPLPELVADVERTIGIGIEAQTRRAAGSGAGREHLDAFAEVVAGYAGDHRADLSGLIAFLAAAEEVENGLEPGEVEVAHDRVQILTVHAAKGLEWEVVAVPHVVRGVFPSGTAAGTWLGALAELPTALRGDRRRADAPDGVPVLDLEDLYDRADLEAAVDAHRDALRLRRLDEERRLFYVALTRTERALFVSAHHWAETGSTPKGPSEFLLDLSRAVDEPGSPLAASVFVDRWSEAPPDDAANPFTDNPTVATWPRDPLGVRRAAVTEGAALVRDALSRLASGVPATPPASPAPTRTPPTQLALFGDPPEAEPGTDAAETTESGADAPDIAAAATGPVAVGSEGIAAEEVSPYESPLDPASPNRAPGPADLEPPPDFGDHELPPDPQDYAFRPDPRESTPSAGDSACGRDTSAPLPAGSRPSEPSAFDSAPVESARASSEPDPHAAEPSDPADDPGSDPEGWAADVDALLAEHFAGIAGVREVELPAQLPATALVEMRADPAALAARLRRPLPYPPSPFARRGTAFHAWLQSWFGAVQLLDMDALSGEGDERLADAEFVRLQEAFLASPWADRQPAEVEVGFETTIAGVLLRGRIDAVFTEPDGRWLVVDWKTGAEPANAQEPAVAMQLAVYRLAWARLLAARTGRPEHEIIETIDAAFHYVRSGRTIRPADLPGARELEALIQESAPRPAE